MTNEQIESEIEDLIELFDNPLPKGKKYKSKEEMFHYLRVKIKYTLFDLEATRRELIVARKK